MTYKRFVTRNALLGGYEASADPFALGSRIAAGDLRRLEQDQRDDAHLERYAVYAGITKEQAKAVLDAFFEGLPS